MIHIQACIRIARHAPGVARDACPTLDASCIPGHSSRLGDLIDETIMIALAVLPAAMSTAIIAAAFGWNLVR